MSRKKKVFKLTDIFCYERGKRFTEKEQISGDVAYISSTKENNGISNFVNPPEKNIKGSVIKIYNNCMTLSNSGSVGYLFYHDYNFVASDHVTVIWIKDKNVILNKYIALYLKPIFETMKYKYNFGREISNRNFELEYIMLPVGEDDMPDWVYMENYIKDLEKDIRFYSIKTENTNKDSLDISSWQWFGLSEIFTMEKGKDDAQSDEDGKYCLVSATQFNNGICGKSNDGNKLFNENLISVASNGEVGETFYQEKPFYATGDVNILDVVDKYKGKLNKYNALFITTMIKQEKFRYAYGRKWGINRMENSKIKLPAILNSENLYEPDWNYMESYIKSLPYSDLL
uniref:Type I restriction modification DNA specificity domain-containing protein n=1 Tax=uncultured Candidatus Melainabacteria bacterium TaxID=2682970 RepID=A0A650EJH2_9BACT|nr:hypothetical protein Melaina855_2670 [uncultured Candidatus Melainabacteria bacterium]